MNLWLPVLLAAASGLIAPTSVSISASLAGLEECLDRDREVGGGRGHHSIRRRQNVTRGVSNHRQVQGVQRPQRMLWELLHQHHRRPRAVVVQRQHLEMALSDVVFEQTPARCSCSGVSSPSRRRRASMQRISTIVSQLMRAQGTESR